ncbi:serpin family protein [Acetivibrio mesophilus]|uniref:Serpin family protein n=1 Tax=Acetivibrio mesophilus TaxID=2487273 RepID=A0A4Q0I6T1_9FIRM|nr:serpin family protein [Acetivibrio mesophilus]ODM24953.1 proteinase IV [Clostridium sp. Bc-iso-3]RXE60050.1 serpin family protein [Acetivibrio mesophilus]HHV30053.1 serpin family protein [Clostridium sp.]
MKRMICIAVSIFTLISILTGCTGDTAFDVNKVNMDVVKSNIEFSFDIFSRLNEEDHDKNVFISPLSISTALSMTVQGAEATTKDGMMKSLKYEGIDLDKVNECYRYTLDYLNKVDRKVELDINNSIWIRQESKIKKDFIDINKDVFNAYVTELDFSKANAVDKINKWISDSTSKKITKVVEPPIPQNTAMYLINAIYFKGEWTEKFKKGDTFSTEFHSGNGQTKEVMMMKRKGEIEYGTRDDFKVVRLPYGNGKTSMYCVLPDESISINDFIKTLDADKWEQIKNSVSKVDDVKLNIPRFKMEYGIKNLNDCLISMGMEKAFSNEADFSGISEKDLYISNVLHKAVIEVNEEGSTAAGITLVEVKDASAMLDAPSFIADRPFLFFITEDITGTILFMGKLYDCEKY